MVGVGWKTLILSLITMSMEKALELVVGWLWDWISLSLSGPPM